MSYAELHARTNFSFLDGASKPEELLAQALALKLPALAVTDVNGLYGLVDSRDKLLKLCRRKKESEINDFRLIYGSELHFDDDVTVAIARTRPGYANLSQAISAGCRAAEKGEFALTLDQLASHSSGLTVLAGGPRSIIMRLLSEGEVGEAEKRLRRLKEIFGAHLTVELVRHLVPGDRERSVAMAALAKRLRIPIVATNDVHFHLPERKRLHDVLRCIQEGCSIRDAGRRLLPNAEAHLKSAQQMQGLFADLPEAIEYSGVIHQSVEFRLSDVTYRPPAPDLPEDYSADSYLAELCWQGLRDKPLLKFDVYRPQLQSELAVIRDLGFAGYFLMMKDVVEECDRRGILCQGRGSAANSLVCYALGVTAVSPETINMLFERFLSKERAEPPDIDLDIEHERREEIIQYVYRKYTREHAGMVAEVIRFRRRSALGEIGKALGFEDDQLHRLSRFMSHMDTELGPQAFAAAGLDVSNPMFRQLYDCMAEIEDFPRHLSIHVGGFVLSEEPLANSVPIENGRMEDRTVIQWNKDDVDSMGMFKLDLLGLGMLTVLSKSFQLVEQHHGKTYTLQSIPPDDQPTYEMLQRADSVGVFQVESRAQMSMLPRLKPKKFYDLVIQVAIVRPGPIQGDMVHPYLRRREGKDPIDYPHPSTESFLKRTLGVPLFQEQAMRLSMAVGGYTSGEANELRRSMATWGRNGGIGEHQEKLTRNMLANGLTQEMVDRLFRQLEGFSAYGFPESHAAAFAHLAYVSSYLKCHYPAEFACALLNSQPMGFYSPAVIINDAKLHDIGIRPIDVQHSEWDSTIESGEIRLGLHMVRGLPKEQGEAIPRARRVRAFSSVEDLAARAGLGQRVMTALAAAGSLQSMHTRREAIWKASVQSPGPLFAGVPLPEATTEMPVLDPLEELRLDITYGRAFPGRHPMSFLREGLTRKGIRRATDIRQIRPGRIVRVAGIVITRQRPGKGTFVYVTLEDETGHVDVAIKYERFVECEDVIRLSPALIVRGILQGEGDEEGNGGARNVAGRYFEPLEIDDMPAAPSHDFH